MRGKVRPFVELGALAAAYVAVAKLGLMMDAVAGFATLVWPASGLSLAALLLFGNRLWPAIALGAFLTNLWTGATVPVAVGIAIGNTLEAVAGAALLRYIPGFSAVARARARCARSHFRRLDQHDHQRDARRPQPHVGGSRGPGRPGRDLASMVDRRRSRRSGGRAAALGVGHQATPGLPSARPRGGRSSRCSR